MTKTLVDKLFIDIVTRYLITSGYFKGKLLIYTKNYRKYQFINNSNN